MHSLSICFIFISMCQSSQSSHWKTTTCVSTWRPILRESIGLIALRIFAKESMFIPKDAGRSHLKSVNDESSTVSWTRATCELSIDITWMPRAEQSKSTSLHKSFITSTTFFRRSVFGSCATRLMAKADAFQDSSTL